MRLLSDIKETTVQFVYKFKVRLGYFKNIKLEFEFIYRNFIIPCFVSVTIETNIPQ